jgi:hypothetical protein
MRLRNLLFFKHGIKAVVAWNIRLQFYETTAFIPGMETANRVTWFF